MCCPVMHVRQNPDQLGEYWPEEPDYSDEYMYHTARRDHTRVFHQKKQYPQNILYKVDCLVCANTNLVVTVIEHTFALSSFSFHRFFSMFFHFGFSFSLLWICCMYCCMFFILYFYIFSCMFFIDLF